MEGVKGWSDETTDYQRLHANLSDDRTVLGGLVGRSNRTDQEADMRTERQEGSSTDGWTY